MTENNNSRANLSASRLRARQIQNGKRVCGLAAALCGRALPYRVAERDTGRLRFFVEVQPLPDQKSTCYGKAKPFRKVLRPSRRNHQFASGSFSQPSSISSNLSTALLKCGIVIEPPTTSATLKASINCSRVTPTLPHCFK